MSAADEPVIEDFDGQLWHLESYLAGMHEAKVTDAAAIGVVIAQDIERYRDRYVGEAPASWVAAMTRAAAIARGEVLVP